MSSCPSKEQIASLLLKLRIKNNKSQAYIAGCLNITRNSYIEWEKGKVDFSMSKVQRICECYDMDFEDFLKILPPPPAEIEPNLTKY
jgi:transcriptional regulator with XRE-family HTH domain